MLMSGVTTNGAAAEYMVSDSKYTVPLPPTLAFEAAAPLMCAGGTRFWHCPDYSNYSTNLLYRSDNILWIEDC